MKKSITITEIAKLAGVSIGTIDRVIHNRGRVAEQTHINILRIIHQKNYKINPLARHLRLSKSYNICALLPKLDSESGYWHLIYNGIQKIEEELENFSFHVSLIEFERADISDYTAKCEQIIKDKPDGLILAPVLQDESLIFLKKIHDKIPYVFVDTDIPQCMPLSTIFQDAFQSGYLSGRIMNMMVQNRRGTIVIIKPYHNAYNLNERERGFYEFYEDNTNTFKLCTLYCEHPPNKKNYYRLTNKLEEKYPDICGVFCVNSSVHLIAEHLKQLKHNTNCVIIGYDLVAENIKNLKENNIDCLISQSPGKQGYDGCYALYMKLILDMDVKKNTYMPIDIVLKENIREEKYV